MLDIFNGTVNWIKEDWQSNRLRFCFEVVAWAISIGCSITMATTVPNPPLIVLYPIWITGCAIYAWCAFTRRSFGMLANYILLTTIDSIGLVRMLINL
jgi:cellulose synthase/poly-beta-1,6-N-acetylglucosamine synthase-like glycosyltransferase